MNSIIVVLKSLFHIISSIIPVPSFPYLEMGFVACQISPKLVVFLVLIYRSTFRSSGTLFIKNIQVNNHGNTKITSEPTTAQSYISLAMNFPISKSYLPMSPATKSIWTSLSMLSLVVGHNLCRARVHHAFVTKFRDALTICYIFAPDHLLPS